MVYWALICFLLCLTGGCTPDPATKESAAAMSQLDAKMAEVIGKARLHDPAVASQADALLARFRTQFRPAGYTRGPNGEFGTNAEGRCLDNPSCFNFVYAPSNASDRFLGGWYDNIRTMFITDAIGLNEDEASFATLHELLHNDQFIRGLPVDPTPRRAGESWPRETETMEFETRLKDAVSGGRLSAVVDSYVADHRAGTAKEVWKYGVVLVMPHDDLFAIYPSQDPDVKGRMFMTASYLLNKKLIQQTVDEPERTAQLATLCANVQTAVKEFTSGR
jgi:hypothetical protein